MKYQSRTPELTIYTKCRDLRRDVTSKQATAIAVRMVHLT
jgi:hypothetical protein